MKAIVYATTFAGMLFSVTGQAQTNLNELEQEMDIMTSILQTALGRNQSRESSVKVRSIDSTYLRDQGVLFTINTSSSSGFNFSFGDFMPVEFFGSDGVQVHTEDSNIVITSEGVTFDDNGQKNGPNVLVRKAEMTHEMQMEQEEEMERQVEEAENYQDRLRELRERNRDLKWEEREYERRQRDMEFEKQAADGEQKRDLEAQLKELTSELKGIADKRVEIEKFIKETSDKLRQRSRERSIQREQSYKRFLADFESNLADVLCKYGAGLKALPMAEHVSFRLPNMGEDEQGHKKDRMYVFNQSHIQKCVAGRITADELLGQYGSYLF